MPSWADGEDRYMAEYRDEYARRRRPRPIARPKRVQDRGSKHPETLATTTDRREGDTQHGHD